MEEYPSIINSSKAPRKHCFAFDKIDGSNFRAKFTQKRGFDSYGTRTQMIDETTPFWSEMVKVFKQDHEKALTDLFKKHKEFRDYREIIVFGEFWGEHSFAGFHDVSEPHKIIMFDVLVGHKQRKFLKPKEFIDYIAPITETAKVVYEGNMNEQLIKDVREGKYDVNEGVICKGIETLALLWEICGNVKLRQMHISNV